MPHTAMWGGPGPVCEGRGRIAIVPETEEGPAKRPEDAGGKPLPSACYPPTREGGGRTLCRS